MFVFVTVSAVNGINAAGRLHMAVAVGHYTAFKATVTFSPLFSTCRFV